MATLLDAVKRAYDIGYFYVTNNAEKYGCNGLVVGVQGTNAFYAFGDIDEFEGMSPEEFIKARGMEGICEDTAQVLEDFASDPDNALEANVYFSTMLFLFNKDGCHEFDDVLSKLCQQAYNLHEGL